MKNLLIIIVITMFMVGCKKQSGTKMTVSELKAKYGIDLIGEEQTSRQGGRKAKADQVVVVWENDLVLSGSVSCTTSPNAQWGGIQKFLAEPLNVEGAVSYCNFYLPPSPMNCPTTTPGVYRGWTSDFDYTIHISNLITIQ